MKGWGEWAWLGGMAGVMALAMLPYSSYVAALPLIQEEWGMTSAGAGSISSAYLAGFALSALLLVPLTDRVPSRWVLLASAWLNGLTNLLFPLLASSWATGLALRFLAGVGPLGLYYPGIRLISERFRGERRGLAVGVYVSAFYIGTVLSLAMMGALLPFLPWRGAYLLTALGALAGGLLLVPLLRGEEEVPRRGGWLDPSALRSRAVLLVITAYGLHAWELYVTRTWLPPFLAEVLTGRGLDPITATARGAGVAALLFGVGTVGPFVGGALSDRLGRTGAALLLFGASGLTASLLGWLAGAPWGLLVALGLLYGFTSAADSSVYSVALTEVAPLGLLGSALAVYGFVGFGAGAVAPVASGWVLDLAPSSLRWGLAFLTAGMAALLAFPLLLWLRALPEAARMAGGRR